MGVLSRSHFQKLLDIENKRTINDILSSMGTYLNHKRLHENVYYLSKQGRDYVGSTEIINKSAQLEHKLMRNDVRIYYGCPPGWKNEAEVVIKTRDLKEVKMIADASFEMQGTTFIVEIDNKQSMANNYKKIDFYARAFPVLERSNRKDLVLLFYTNTEFRKQKIDSYCKDKNITAWVFTKRDLE